MTLHSYNMLSALSSFEDKALYKNCILLLLFILLFRLNDFRYINLL